MKKSLYFCAIGGSGMLPLALIMKSRGYEVVGSDRSYDQGRVPERFSYLKKQGVKMFLQDGSGVSDHISKMIVSAAVEETVADYQAAKDKNIPIVTRAEMLAEIVNSSKTSIGVAGTSGKSTVTGMIGWILSCASAVYKEQAPTIINGATMKNFVNEEHPLASCHVGDPNRIVAEIDESDGSIANYTPTIGVINNIAHDHKSMDELRTLFKDYAKRAEKIILNLDNAETAKLAESLPKDKQTSFSLQRADADLLAINIKTDEEETFFDVICGGKSKTYTASIPLFGQHNVANAMAALSAVTALGIDLELAIDALSYFEGTARRMDIIGEEAGVTVIDDFAHNPDKISATLATLQESEGHNLILFQPHGFGPLALLRNELVKSFSKGLSANDWLVLSDPLYLGGTTSREVTSADIAQDCMARGINAMHIEDREDGLKELVSKAQKNDKIVIMGARDDSLTALAQKALKLLKAKNT